jgi:hypothetical protein
MNPAASGAPNCRLSDNVFWRTHAEIGDRIEERQGGMLLVTEAMACHPIQLSAPRPLEVATAFGHADAVLREGRQLLEALVADGSAIEVSTRSTRTARLQRPDMLLPEDHPLVVTTRPRDLEVDPKLPAGRG